MFVCFGVLEEEKAGCLFSITNDREGERSATGVAYTLAEAPALARPLSTLDFRAGRWVKRGVDSSLWPVRFF